MIERGPSARPVLYQLLSTPDTALVRRSTLEDVFLTITGRSLVE